MTHLEHDWFPAALPDACVIGERSWLYSSYAFHHARSDRVRIGPDTGVYEGTHFELGPRGSVTIGRFCTVVGAIIAIDCPLVIGDHTFIAHEVVIGADDWACPPGATTGRARARSGAAGGEPAPASPATPAIEIGEAAWIGTRAVILAGARIGAEAVIGAGAVIRGEVPPGATAVGNPARILGGRG